MMEDDNMQDQLCSKATLKKALNNLETLLAVVAASEQNDATCSDNVTGTMSMMIDEDGNDVEWRDFDCGQDDEVFVIGGGSLSDGDSNSNSNSSYPASWSSDSENEPLNEFKSAVQSLSSHFSKQNSKKHVSFADTAGKPLVAICSFGNTPYEMTPPNENASAISNLLNLLQQSAIFNPGENGAVLEPLFPDPLADYTALVKKLRQNSVALESICTRGSALKGMIRAHICFEAAKEVFVRVTFDSWKNSHDWTADVFPIALYDCPQYDSGDYFYDEDENDDCNYDLYEFFVPIPPHLKPDSLIHFAVCFRNSGGDCWDNNDGKNYSLRYHPPTSLPTMTNGFTNAAELDSYRAKWIREIVCPESAAIKFDDDFYVDENSNGHNNKVALSAEIQVPYW